MLRKFRGLGPDAGLDEMKRTLEIQRITASGTFISNEGKKVLFGGVAIGKTGVALIK